MVIYKISYDYKKKKKIGHYGNYKIWGIKFELVLYKDFLYYIGYYGNKNACLLRINLNDDKVECIDENASSNVAIVSSNGCICYTDYGDVKVFYIDKNEIIILDRIFGENHIRNMKIEKEYLCYCISSDNNNTEKRIKLDISC